jgi:hypothetical protein
VGSEFLSIRRIVDGAGKRCLHPPDRTATTIAGGAFQRARLTRTRSVHLPQHLNGSDFNLLKNKLAIGVNRRNPD